LKTFIALQRFGDVLASPANSDDLTNIHCQMTPSCCQVFCHSRARAKGPRILLKKKSNGTAVTPPSQAARAWPGNMTWARGWGGGAARAYSQIGPERVSSLKTFHFISINCYSTAPRHHTAQPLRSTKSLRGFLESPFTGTRAWMGGWVENARQTNAHFTEGSV